MSVAGARAPSVAGVLPRPRQRAILAILVAAQLTIWLDSTILNVALKTLGDPVAGLAASPSELEWAISAYMLIFASLLFTGGVLADRYGRRRLLSVGLAVFGVASVWAAYSRAPTELIAARAAMGLGSALVVPATLAVITDVFSEADRAQAIAVWSGASGLAVAVGPLLGGALLERAWWGSLFLVNLPVVAVALIGVRALVPESRDPAPPRLDLVGLGLSVAGLTALVFAIIRGGEIGAWSSAEVLAPLIASLVLLVLFVLVELRTSDASFDVRLFANPRFAGASAAIMLTFFGLLGSMFFAIFWLQGVRGLSPLDSGLILLPVGAGVVLGAALSPRLVHGFGVRTVTSLALLAVVASFLGYLLMGVRTPLWRFELLVLVQGLGMGAVMAPTTEVIMSTLPRARAGAGAAVGVALRQVGGVLGVAVLGSILYGGYRSRIQPALDGLALSPAGHEAAAQSTEATKRLAEGAGRPGLAAAADEAFVSAMHGTALWAAAAAALGMVLLIAFLRPQRSPS